MEEGLDEEDRRRSTFSNPCYEDTIIYASIDNCKHEATELTEDCSSTAEKNVCIKMRQKKARVFQITCFSFLVLGLVGTSMLAIFSLREIVIIQGKLKQLIEQVNHTQPEDSQLKALHTLVKNLGTANDAVKTEFNSLMTMLANQLNAVQSLENTLKEVDNSTRSQLGSIESSLASLMLANSSIISQLNNLSSSVQTLFQVNNQVSKLESSVDTLNGSLAQLWVLQTSVQALTVANNKTNSQLDRIQSTVNQLSSVQDTLMSKLSSLNSHFHDLETSVKNTISESIVAAVTPYNSLQLLVNNLTAQLNTTVNWYQSCIDSIEVCDIGNGTLWRGCATPRLPITMDGFYTIDTKCEYRGTRNYLESAVLFRLKELVWCECDVTWPKQTFHKSRVGNNFEALNNELSGNCTLIITQCPLP